MNTTQGNVTIGDTVYLPDGWNQDNTERPYREAVICGVFGRDGWFSVRLVSTGQVMTVSPTSFFRVA